MMRTKLRMLLVAPETTYGAGANIEDAVMLITSELDSNPYEGDRITRERMQPTFGANQEINAAPYSTITTTIPLAGSGTPGTPPNFHQLLRSCGLSEEIEENISVTYQPVTNSQESCCVWFVEEGQVQEMPGVRGNVELNLTAKQDPTQQYTLTGMYKKVAQLGTQIEKQITDIAEELVVNKQNTPVRNVHGYAGCLQSLSLNMGNEVVHRNLIGCETVKIIGRESKGQVEIEAPNIATKDYFAAIESHNGVTKDEVKIGHGTEPGNIVTLTGPKVQLSTLSRSDSNGIVHYTMDTIYTRNQGDDEFTLVFT